MSILKKIAPVLLLAVLLGSPLTMLAQPGYQGGTGGTGYPGGTGGTGYPGGTGGTGYPGGTGASSDGTFLVNPLKADSLEGLLYLLLEVAVRLGVIVLTLMLIWVGFLFVAARGNEEKLRTARTAFMWTIIGGLLLLGAKGIAEVIRATATSL